MAMKRVFFPKNYKNCLAGAAGGKAPGTPPEMRLSCIDVFSTPPRLDNFWTKKFSILVQTSLNEILVARLQPNNVLFLTVFQTFGFSRKSSVICCACI